MSIFGLDPDSVLARIRVSSITPKIPSLAASVTRGAIGFAVVSIAAFLPWVFAGKWAYKNPGEIVMYSMCAAIFILLSGVALAPLIIGPGALKRFYALFTIAFICYSAAWIAAWMCLRGVNVHARGAIGLFAGCSLMCALFAAAFSAWREFPKMLAAIFVLNAAGYFAGVGIEIALSTFRTPTVAVVMKLLWGFFFGIGFGAGLGVAFHLSQRQIRTLLLA
jgi:hypothetical protein